MKRSGPNKHRNILHYMLAFAFLFLAASPALVHAGAKRAQLNEKYRIIAERMKEAYENGELHRVLDMYNRECRKPGGKTGKWRIGKENKGFKKVKKDIRAEIYHSLALSLIALDRPKLGDVYIKKILVLRRDEGTGKYWLSIRETAKNKYYVAPRLLIGLNAGANFTTAHPQKRYSILNSKTEIDGTSYQKDYVFSFNHSRGTHAGIILEYVFSRNLSVSIQPEIGSMRFQYENSFIRGGENDDGEPDTTTLNYTHRQKLGCLGIPVLFKYRFPGKTKFSPYFQVGGYIRLVQSAIKTVNGISLPDGDYREEAIIDMKKQFVGTAFGLQAGAGIAYDGKWYRLQIEANYKHGFTNIIDEAMRFKNDQLLYAFYDVSDDIKVRNWDLSLKVLLPISYKAFRR